MPLVLIIIIVVVASAWLVVVLGVLPSPFCRTLIRIKRGEIRLEKGDLNPRAKEHVADVIREFQLHEGFITLSSSRAVAFSHGFPEVLRQRLRNILLN